MTADEESSPRVRRSQKTSHVAPAPTQTAVTRPLVRMQSAVIRLTP